MVLTSVSLTLDGDTYFLDRIENQWKMTERHEQEDLAFCDLQTKVKAQPKKRAHAFILEMIFRK